MCIRDRTKPEDQRSQIRFKAGSYPGTQTDHVGSLSLRVSITMVAGARSMATMSRGGSALLLVVAALSFLVALTVWTGTSGGGPVALLEVAEPQGAGDQLFRSFASAPAEQKKQDAHAPMPLKVKANLSTSICKCCGVLRVPFVSCSA
eukprot:194159-Rhodomonas_salina.1